MATTSEPSITDLIADAQASVQQIAIAADIPYINLRRYRTGDRLPDPSTTRTIAAGIEKEAKRLLRIAEALRNHPDVKYQR